MKTYPFSNTEKQVIAFILQQEENIQNLSTRAIGEATFTSPSLLVRISKKLGFNGYQQFKSAYLEEIKYIKQIFHDIDANKPFSPTDNIMRIASKIIQVKKESLDDTASLIHHDTLQKAVHYLEKANRIKIFCLNNLNFAAEEFKYKMYRINKQVIINAIEGELFFEAAMSLPDDIAILISYSGHSDDIIQTAQILKKRSIPMIAITSIGDNPLSKIVDVTLHITTREKSYSKIAGYTSIESINTVLDILYSCFFALHYEENLNFRIHTSQEVEYDRNYNNTIISE